MRLSVLPLELGLINCYFLLGYKAFQRNCATLRTDLIYGYWVIHLGTAFTGHWTTAGIPVQYRAIIAGDNLGWAHE